MRWKYSIFVFTLLIYSTIISCGGGGGCAKKPDDLPGRRFPDFKKTASDGVEYSAKELSDGAAVASFLVSWCLTCGHELVALQEIKDELGDDAPQIIIFTFEDPANLRELMDSLEVDLPVIRADSSVFANLQIDAIPTRILLENRHEVLRITGAPNFEEAKFRSMLRKNLGLPAEPVDSA